MTMFFVYDFDYTELEEIELSKSQTSSVCLEHFSKDCFVSIPITVH